jgi:P2-related tail formation protein
MVNIKLPFWLRGQDIKRMAAAAKAFWEKIETVINWHNAQIDPLNCDEPILDLLAWERDIKRIDDEPLNTYRNRVKNAYANANDAGNIAGFKRIFKRLGVKYVELYERDPELDWDIITIHMEELELSNKQAFIEDLIQKYGRTCRRYQYVLVNLISCYANVGHFEHEQSTVHAVAP